MKKYSIKLQANKRLEEAINQEIVATFELHAISRKAAAFRAQKMMDYIMEGYIEDKQLNRALADEGCIVLEIIEA